MSVVQESMRWKGNQIRDRTGGGMEGQVHEEVPRPGSEAKPAEQSTKAEQTEPEPTWVKQTGLEPTGSEQTGSEPTRAQQAGLEPPRAELEPTRAE